MPTMCRFGKILAMIAWLRHLLGWLIGVFGSRQDLMLENLVIRQQLLALLALTTGRPRRRLTRSHKLFCHLGPLARESS
jgi:hypothetical protein